VAKRNAKCGPLCRLSGRALARLSAKEGIGFGGACWPDGAESQQQPQPQAGESDVSGERTKPQRVTRRNLADWLRRRPARASPCRRPSEGTVPPLPPSRLLLLSSRCGSVLSRWTRAGRLGVVTAAWARSESLSGDLAGSHYSLLGLCVSVPYSLCLWLCNCLRNCY
jgi:hypothetical protein